MKKLNITDLEKEQSVLEYEMVVVSESVQQSLTNPVFSTDGKASPDYDELSKRFEKL